MKSDYQEAEREKSIELIKTSSLFEHEKAGQLFMRAERDFVLMNGLKNLFSSVRQEIIEYFSKNAIAWWGGSKPTGHVLSSQIACLNHLFPIRNDRKAVLEMIKVVSDDFIDVLEITTDKFLAGYIQFEAVSENDYLNEGKPTRGNNCTSIDALVYAQHKDGSKWLIPIEWKYTEYYENQDKSIEGFKVDPINCKGTVRKNRYTDLINNSYQLKNTDHKCYYFEPFYQLMRQTLWTEQMIKNKNKETLKADNYFHIHVIPNENKDLLFKQYKCSGKDLETTWKSHLNNPEKYKIISPEKLLSNSLIDSKYDELQKYLALRYWNK
jgi:hypothetical protein